MKTGRLIDLDGGAALWSQRNPLGPAKGSVGYQPRLYTQFGAVNRVMMGRSGKSLKFFYDQAVVLGPDGKVNKRRGEHNEISSIVGAKRYEFSSVEDGDLFQLTFSFNDSRELHIVAVGKKLPEMFEGYWDCHFQPQEGRVLSFSGA